ncbi:hypothetical protein [Natrialba sp. INN-245]|uniref:hypothetical protein n=1 Tax=Natrialba sp. INN-245 TaxID=2690967 RepID=UPI001310D924|nr:hypothetical protein [Natrialba sp. INN-245]MWV40726.1 hypothetical protein [Natrialba sp. INN-245]
MKSPGLLWMLQTAAGLSMAGPMFIVGIEFLRTGRIVPGVGMFAVGLVALYLPTYLVNRIGGPRAWIRRRLGHTDAGSSEPESERRQSDDGSDPTLSSPLDRLRKR